MITQIALRRHHDDDLHDAVFPLIVPFGGMLSAASPSTTTGLGMPLPSIRADVEALLGSPEAMTNAASLMVEQFWKTYLSTTETGVPHLLLAVTGPDEVRQLRDDVSRRTRLTRQQIARALGVDRRSLSSWVKGSAIPGPDRLERLRQLAVLVREIDSVRAGRATEVLLSRRRGRDLLDMIADGRFDQARNWQRMEPGDPSVRMTSRRAEGRKPPLFSAALTAYREGRLSAPPRATTVRDLADYEQDLSHAERTFPDRPSRPRRRQYR